MFTGLVECVAQVRAAWRQPPGLRLAIELPAWPERPNLGDSIAVDGCCLTVVSLDEGCLWFEAGSETLSRTTLGRCQAGTSVNLERSLQLGDRLGGHLVTGHIDGLATLVDRLDDGVWSHFWLSVPPALQLQIASKGSVALDGVSLTVVEVQADRFSVALIPHTLAVTTLGRRRVGDHLNLETDLLAKYVQRQLFPDRPCSTP